MGTLTLDRPSAPMETAPRFGVFRVHELWAVKVTVLTRYGPQSRTVPAASNDAGRQWIAGQKALIAEWPAEYAANVPAYELVTWTGAGETHARLVNLGPVQ